MKQKDVAGIFLEIFIVVLVLSLLLAIAIPHIGQMLRKNGAEPRDTEPQDTGTAVTEMLCVNGPGIVEPVIWVITD